MQKPILNTTSELSSCSIDSELFHTTIDLVSYFNIFVLFQIAKKVCMIFCIYFPALLGFTFVFMLLLPNSEAFQLHIQSFVKTVAMMLGELEYQDTFLDLDEYINLFFFTFVVLISIIINNLLVGLTVDNVADLLKDAEFKSLESKITTISQIEKSYVLKKVSLLF